MFLVWLGMFAAAPAFGANTPLTFQDAIHVALKESPSFDSAEKSLTINELQYKNAIAKLLPSLDFTSTDGLQNNVPISSNSSLLFTPNPTAPWYSTLSLGLTETLYDNGVSLTNLSIADLNRDLARLNRLKARDTLILNVAVEYYNYSLATALLNVRKQQQSALERQYDLISSQYQQGFKTRADFLRIKTQVQQAEIDSITAENTIEQSVAHLRQLLGANLGKDGPVLFSPLGVNENDPFGEFDSVTQPGMDTDLESFYDARATKIQEEINDRSVDLAWRKYYPEFSLTSGVSYNNQSYINGDQPFAAGHQLSWQALLTVHYNFWDWGSRRRDVEIAQSTRDTQADTLNLALQQTQETAEQLVADISRIRHTYRLTRELLRDQEESNGLVERQYREGKVTYLDLITSLNGLLEAKVQFFNIYFEALQNRAKLNYYKGNIYESLAQE